MNVAGIIPGNRDGPVTGEGAATAGSEDRAFIERATTRLAPAATEGVARGIP